MRYDFSELQSRIDEIKDWLVQEYKSIRTGRATPALLDGVFVDNYGTRMPLNQVSNISIEDARTLRIVPYDLSQIKEVEKAITEANLGVTVSADSGGVRVIFPELTAERREMLIKIAKDKREEARISLRQARDETWSDIQEKERAGELTEDEKFAAKEEMESIVKEANEAIDAIFEKKVAEIQE